MKFGAVTDEALRGIDLRLPPDPTFNGTVLNSNRTSHPKVYIGAARWGDSSWAGKLYPPKTPASKFRILYPDYFNAIELNATHYNIYPPSIIRQWAETTKGKDFKFCPKFPQQISHQSNFINTGDLTYAFLESVTALEENLGPIFLQISESVSPVQKGPLFAYLSSLPKGLRFFLEVRHPAWFSNEKDKEELFATLRSLNIGAVITDAPGRRDAAHMYLPLPKLFLRFVCNALHPTSFSRTDAWINRLKNWIDTGLNEAYVFIHPGNDAAVPELVAYWVENVNKNCNLTVKAPEPLQQQLF